MRAIELAVVKNGHRKRGVGLASGNHDARWNHYQVCRVRQWPADAARDGPTVFGEICLCDKSQWRLTLGIGSKVTFNKAGRNAESARQSDNSSPGVQLQVGKADPAVVEDFDLKAVSVGREGL